MKEKVGVNDFVPEARMVAPLGYGLRLRMKVTINRQVNYGPKQKKTQQNKPSNPSLSHELESE